MKRINALTLLLLSSSLVLCGCNNEANSNNIDDSYSSSLVEDPIVVEARIPQTITFKEKKYDLAKDESASPAKIKSKELIGYIVKSNEDADALKEKHQGEDLYYVIYIGFYDMVLSIGEFYSIEGYEDQSKILLTTPCTRWIFNERK